MSIRKVGDVVPYPEAEKRVLAYMKRGETYKANQVAEVIWPGNRMTSQGAGGAAARVLRKMANKGLVAWHAQHGNWGWKRV